ncbi:glutamate receptor-like [Gigantopelta aegis]|uniref:glutamate receptor-like n=1 Tax=Gigantopelta aegis TaxID=1735272 RepID=UPI001B88E56B|nr:glutamate receptor-like [Gigantopelta aegis]
MEEYHLRQYRNDMFYLDIIENMKIPLSLTMQSVKRIDSSSNRTTDFNYHSKWLVLLHSGNIDTSVYSLDNLHNVAFINAVCNSEVQKSIGEMTIMTLVHHGTTTSLQRVPYNKYLNNNALFPALKYGYNKRKLVVSVTPASAFILKTTKNNMTKYTGFCIYLLEALANTLNFTYELVEPEHGTWGVLINGSWNGLVGQMKRREADLALADLTININRSKVMDFLLPPIYYDYVDIIYKEDNNIPSTWMTLLRPFSATVFILIAVSTVGVFVLYSAAMVVIRNKYTCRKEPRTVTDVVWFTISSLFKQGYNINPSTHGIRILVSAWLLFTVIIVAEYTANLAAAFTVRPGVKPFASLRQLLDSPEYKIGIFPGSITTMLLKNSDNPEYREMWAKIVEDSKTDPDVFSESSTNQMKKIKRGNYAFIRNDGAIRTYMKENCGLQRLGITLDWQPACLGVPEHSTMKYDFVQTMRWLETSGIYEYWWFLHQSNLKTPICLSRQRSVSSSITLDDIKTGFAFLGAGIGAAFVSLVVEIFKNRYH